MTPEKHDVLIIREALPTDKGSIVKLVNSSLPEFDAQYDGAGSESDLENFSDNYLRARATFLVVLKAGDIIGTIGLIPVDQTCAKLRKMYVKPEFRAIGLGSILVEQIIQKANAFGYKKLVLETMTVMKSAIRLYQRFGFYKVDRSAVSRRCDIVMEKAL